MNQGPMACLIKIQAGKKSMLRSNQTLITKDNPKLLLKPLQNEGLGENTTCYKFIFYSTGSLMVEKVLQTLWRTNNMKHEKQKALKSSMICISDTKILMRAKDTRQQENTTSLLLNVALHKLVPKVWLARGACKIKFPQPFGSLEPGLNNWWGQWVVAVAATVIWFGSQSEWVQDPYRHPAEGQREMSIAPHLYTEASVLHRESSNHQAICS